MICKTGFTIRQHHNILNNTEISNYLFIFKTLTALKNLFAANTTLNNKEKELIKRMTAYHNNIQESFLGFWDKILIRRPQR